jgi:hypothetical protein
VEFFKTLMNFLNFPFDDINKILKASTLNIINISCDHYIASPFHV